MVLPRLLQLWTGRTLRRNAKKHKTTRRALLAVEQLESRALLSTSGPLTLQPFPSVSLSHTQTAPIVVNLQTEGNSGPVQFAAKAEGVDGVAYDLDRTLKLSSTGNYHVNQHGLAEKNLTGAKGTAYILLPSGDLYRWGGSGAS